MFYKKTEEYTFMSEEYAGYLAFKEKLISMGVIFTEIVSSAGGYQIRIIVDGKFDVRDDGSFDKEW